MMDRLKKRRKVLHRMHMQQISEEAEEKTDSLMSEDSCEMHSDQSEFEVHPERKPKILLPEPASYQQRTPFVHLEKLKFSVDSNGRVDISKLSSVQAKQKESDTDDKSRMSSASDSLQSSSSSTQDEGSKFSSESQEGERFAVEQVTYPNFEDEDKEDFESEADSYIPRPESYEYLGGHSQYLEEEEEDGYYEERDQEDPHEWLNSGKLPRFSFIKYGMDEKEIEARERLLAMSHVLKTAVDNVKKLIRALDIKQEVLEKKNHPKLYLWSEKWEGYKPDEDDLETNMSKTMAAAGDVPSVSDDMETEDEEDSLLHPGENDDDQSRYSPDAMSSEEFIDVSSTESADSQTERKCKQPADDFGVMALLDNEAKHREMHPTEQKRVDEVQMLQDVLNQIGLSEERATVCLPLSDQSLGWGESPPSSGLTYFFRDELSQPAANINKSRACDEVSKGSLFTDPPVIINVGIPERESEEADNTEQSRNVHPHVVDNDPVVKGKIRDLEPRITVEYVEPFPATYTSATQNECGLTAESLNMEVIPSRNVDEELNTPLGNSTGEEISAQQVAEDQCIALPEISRAHTESILTNESAPSSLPKDEDNRILPATTEEARELVKVLNQVVSISVDTSKSNDEHNVQSFDNEDMIQEMPLTESVSGITDSTLSLNNKETEESEKSGDVMETAKASPKPVENVAEMFTKVTTVTPLPCVTNNKNDVCENTSQTLDSDTCSTNISQQGTNSPSAGNILTTEFDNQRNLQANSHCSVEYEPVLEAKNSTVVVDTLPAHTGNMSMSPDLLEQLYQESAQQNGITTDTSGLQFPFDQTELLEVIKTIQEDSTTADSEQRPQKVYEPGPQPETPIQNEVCRKNLQEHINEVRKKAEMMLSVIDEKLTELESFIDEEGRISPEEVNKRLSNVLALLELMKNISRRGARLPPRNVYLCV